MTKQKVCFQIDDQEQTSQKSKMNNINNFCHVEFGRLSSQTVHMSRYHKSHGTTMLYDSQTYHSKRYGHHYQFFCFLHRICACKLERHKKLYCKLVFQIQQGHFPLMFKENCNTYTFFHSVKNELQDFNSLQPFQIQISGNTKNEKKII